MCITNICSTTVRYTHITVLYMVYLPILIYSTTKARTLRSGHREYPNDSAATLPEKARHRDRGRTGSPSSGGQIQAKPGKI